MSAAGFHAETGLEEYAEKFEDELLKTRPEDQVLPTPNEEEFTHNTLLGRLNTDVPKRLQLGFKRYGQGLQPFNGRDAEQDAWEEYLDLGAYLEQLRREREAMVSILQAVAKDAAEWHGVVAHEARELLESMGIPVGDEQ